MKKALCMILLALATSAQAQTAAEQQYQADQLTLNKAFNRCNEIANAQQAMQRTGENKFIDAVAPIDPALAATARNAPRMTPDLCWSNFKRKSDALNARQPQEIKAASASRAQAFDRAQDDLNAEAIR